jgi:hypothetical protein
VNGEAQCLDPGSIVIRHWMSARSTVSVGHARRTVTEGVVSVVAARSINWLRRS